MKNLIRYISKGSIYGKLMLLIGVLIAVPILIIPFFPEEIKYAHAFLIPAFLSIVLGVLTCRYHKPQNDDSGEWQSPLQRGSLPVLFAWCFGFLTGAIPFVISGDLDFIKALFESVSGWTTTGFSVADVTKLSHVFLFHRSFMQYCGGLGFILMMLMLVGGKQAVTLFNAEGHPDRLMPSIRQTVQTIFIIYNAFLVLGTIAYSFFGMHIFDAICHTMSALSTAGFTTQVNSIGGYGSYPIELITIILMLIGSTNFAVLLLLTRFRFKKIFKVTELRFMIGMLAIFVPLIALSLIDKMDMGIGESIHQSLFGIVTVFTTTGYSTMDYAAWPSFAVGLLMLLMIVGGSIGSTAGGIKLARIYLLLRIARANIKKKISPSRSVTVLNYYRAQGKTPIDTELITDTVGFVLCYFIVLICGTLLITLTEDCSLFDAMFEFTSAFGTVGISNGLTNPDTKNTTLIIEMFGMILGRLEIFIVFIGIHSVLGNAKNLFLRKYYKEASYDK
ncbi:TrkH family potassium uptake protein [Lachnospiraceae bacterium OttesenSCG-928-D06]|nr:TrkH family potassium uptake protein [Lachnospiraceae bacterium OttesenSCG-928-D06]